LEAAAQECFWAMGASRLPGLPLLYHHIRVTIRGSLWYLSHCR
jgi:hypothetical protein